MGGAGSAVRALAAAGVVCPVLSLGLPDVFIEHGDPAFAGLCRAGCGRHRTRCGGTVRRSHLIRQRRACRTLKPRPTAHFRGKTRKSLGACSYNEPGSNKSQVPRPLARAPSCAITISERTTLIVVQSSSAPVWLVCCCRRGTCRARTGCHRWRLASSFSSLDTIYGGAEVFAKAVKAMSGGKFEISVHVGGELMPPSACSMACRPVRSRCAIRCLTTSTARTPAFAPPVGGSLGFNARQMNA